jgi:KDO2-lipid IV(A) lauroyltransferase
LAVAGLVEYWILRFVLFTTALFPPLSRLYTKLFDLAVPKLRRVAKKNLAIADIPDEGVIDGVYRSIARLLATFARFPSMSREIVHRLVRYQGLENFQSAMARGRGVLVATAHFGNWEFSAFAHAYLTGPMHVVVRPLDNPRVDALVERYRALSGNPIIEKKDAARSILKALKSGAAVGILIDQNVTLDEGVFIEFFGEKACAGSAFAKLAHHSGAAVVPGYALWHEDERRYAIHFEPEIEMTGDVQADTQRIHSRLEKAILQHADQYLWLHRRWKTRPPGEAPIY